MKGTNELHLCKAEMLVALQEYLDKRLGPYAPQAVNVRATPDSATFIVALTAKPSPEASS